MNIRVKLTTGLLAALALAMTAGLANAQSTEYRGGYDQGYRDGLLASRTGERGPSMTIERAFYGAQGQFCDARDAVQQLVGRRGAADFTVDNSLCGDPVPEARKVLRVAYNCGGTLRRTSALEGANLHLSCR